MCAAMSGRQCEVVLWEEEEEEASAAQWCVGEYRVVACSECGSGGCGVDAVQRSGGAVSRARDQLLLVSSSPLCRHAVDAFPPPHSVTGLPQMSSGRLSSSCARSLVVLSLGLSAAPTDLPLCFRQYLSRASEAHGNSYHHCLSLLPYPSSLLTALSVDTSSLASTAVSQLKTLPMIRLTPPLPLPLLPHPHVPSSLFVPSKALTTSSLPSPSVTTASPLSSQPSPPAIPSSPPSLPSYNPSPSSPTPSPPPSSPSSSSSTSATTTSPPSYAPKALPPSSAPSSTEALSPG